MATMAEFERRISKAKQIGGAAGKAALAEVASEAGILYDRMSSDEAKEKFKNTLEEIGVKINTQQPVYANIPGVSENNKENAVYANALTINNKNNDETVYANAALEKHNSRNRNRSGAVSYVQKEEVKPCLKK